MSEIADGLKEIKAASLLSEMQHLGQIPDYWREAAENVLSGLTLQGLPDEIGKLAEKLNDELQEQTDRAERSEDEAVMLASQVEEFAAIVQAEFCYWRKADDENDTGMDFDFIAMGCMSACSNILAALQGHLSPWHPGYAAKQDDDDLEPARDEDGELIVDGEEVEAN